MSWQQMDICGKHAEQHPVNKVRHQVRFVVSLSEIVRDPREFGSNVFRKFLARFAWSQLPHVFFGTGIAKNTQPTLVRQVIETELVAQIGRASCRERVCQYV